MRRPFELRPRVLRDVGTVSTVTTVLGTAVAMPVLVAPTAYQRPAADLHNGITQQNS